MSKSNVPKSGLCLLLSLTLALGMVPTSAFAEAGGEAGEVRQLLQGAQLETNASEPSGVDADASENESASANASQADPGEATQSASDGAETEAAGTELPEGLTLASSTDDKQQTSEADVSSDDDATDLGGAYMLGFLDGQVRYLATGNSVELDHGTLTA